MYTLCRSTLWYQDSYCFNTHLAPVGCQKYMNNEHSSYRAVLFKFMIGYVSTLWTLPLRKLAGSRGLCINQIRPNDTILNLT